MKVINKILVLILLISVITSCKKEEEIIIPEIEKTVFGQWEIVSGDLLLEDSKYFYIDSNNTVTLLTGDNLAFNNSLKSNATISDNQITWNIGSYTSIMNYELNEDDLTLEYLEDEKAVLRRITTGPKASEWNKKIIPLELHATPWETSGDIAFNGTHILFTNNGTGNDIAYINPNTLEIDGLLLGFNTRAIEIEKNNDLATKKAFIANNIGYNFDGYLYSTVANVFTSLSFDNHVSGLASVNGSEIWVANSSLDQLKLYNYNTSSITKTVNLSREANGLCYANGFLYVCGWNKVYKCQTTPTFKAIQTYTLKSYDINGITYDGENFWLNTENDETSEHKLIKVSLD